MCSSCNKERTWTRQALEDLEDGIKEKVLRWLYKVDLARVYRPCAECRATHVFHVRVAHNALHCDDEVSDVYVFVTLYFDVHHPPGGPKYIYPIDYQVEGVETESGTWVRSDDGVEVEDADCKCSEEAAAEEPAGASSAVSVSAVSTSQDLQPQRRAATWNVEDECADMMVENWSSDEDDITPAARRKRQDKLMREGPGFVYIMTDSTGRFKVGSSRNVERRLRQLQCGNPDLRVVEQYRTTKRYAAESAAHQTLEDHHHHWTLEWFHKLDAAKCKQLVEDANRKFRA
jgi:predicted GIY-YIG superfamily endonuclease